MLKLKKVYYALLLIIIAFAGCSAKKQVNPEPYGEESFQNKKIKEEAYQEAITKIRAEEEKKAEQKYEAVLKKYEEHFYRIELGKLAIEKAYVSYPEIITFKDSKGRIFTDSLGCKIQKPLKLQEIIELYASEISKINNNVTTVSNGSIESIKNTSPGIALENTNYHQGNIEVQDAVPTQTKIVELEKTYYIKEILDDRLLPYSLEDGKYIVSFNNYSDKKSFCDETGVCRKGN